MGTRHSADGRPIPWPNPTTRPFFDAARERRLRLQRCPRDGFFFYPRSRCPRCLGADWEWRDASGRGVVHSFSVDRVGHLPGLERAVPYAIAIVELEEGPRLTARIVDCDVDALRVGAPVEARYEDVEDVTLLHFAPRSA
ncbi:MAG TPA: Zn-ribbon domain-containing OB-fold protein [Myxococcota bacterium]|nr:Zn-ribbon domain-containing OB-fold protein [Myxococcota bacterium]